MGFDELEEDFLRITTETVFCVATTVDLKGRPRGRVLHPVFVVRDGRALTGRTPLKTRHLEANPHMSCAYWSPSQDTAACAVARAGDARAGVSGGQAHRWCLAL